MKKFLGFNPEQQFTILSKMGYEGPKESSMMEAYAASNPAAASKLSDYSRRAQELLNGPQMAEGGVVTDSGQMLDLNASKDNLAKMQEKLSRSAAAVQASPEDAGAKTTLESVQKEYVAAQKNLNVANKQYATTNLPSGAEAVGKSIATPQSLLTQATPTKVETTPEQFIAPTEGQTPVVAPVTASTVDTTAQAVAPEKVAASTVGATKVAEGVKTELEGMQAATAEPSKAATVQGQLEGLMAQFEGGATPPWASGAMRQAMGIMQQRGLGASSIAGQAVVQAAMESAIAIASQDASTVAQFEMQNLNNEQQTAIFKTQQIVASMFSDQAADNASKQFNAASENQVNQFFAGLQESVSRFNADQVNGIMQFNSGQENAVEQFNSSLKAQRDQFNAQNSLIIAQANAQWRQNIATLDTAATNEANMNNVKSANALTGSALEQIWQRERDLMDYAFKVSEGALNRDVSLLLADKEIAASVNLQNAELDYRDNVARNTLLGDLATSIFKWY